MNGQTDLLISKKHECLFLLLMRPKPIPRRWYCCQHLGPSLLDLESEPVKREEWMVLKLPSDWLVGRLADWPASSWMKEFERVGNPFFVHPQKYECFCLALKGLAILFFFFVIKNFPFPNRRITRCIDVVYCTWKMVVKFDPGESSVQRRFDMTSLLVQGRMRIEIKLETAQIFGWYLNLPFHERANDRPSLMRDVLSVTFVIG